jgi:hypothetical protein
MNSDIHGSAEYRAHLVGVMAKRALAAAGWSAFSLSNTNGGLRVAIFWQERRLLDATPT